MEKLHSLIIWTMSSAYLLIIFNCKTISAQDTLTLVTGAKMAVDIKEVNEEYILFSLWQDSTSITKLPLDRVYSYSREDQISKINLKPEEEKLILGNLPKDPAAIKTMAITDARKNFNYSTVTGIGTFFTTVFATPVVGLIVAVPTSATPPVDKALNAPNELYFKNTVYYDAYKKEAHKIKKRNIWTGFALGLVVEAIIVVAIASEFE